MSKGIYKTRMHTAARKENDRLYNKMRKLKGENPERQIKISKGKLLDGENVVDEFNITIQFFK